MTENTASDELGFLLLTRDDNLPAMREMLKANPSLASCRVNDQGERCDEGGMLPLNMAAFRGQDEAVRLLLDNGADINAVDGDGHTPLTAAQDKKHATTVKLLLNRGAKESSPQPANPGSKAPSFPQ